MMIAPRFLFFLAVSMVFYAQPTLFCEYQSFWNLSISPRYDYFIASNLSSDGQYLVETRHLYSRQTRHRGQGCRLNLWDLRDQHFKMFNTLDTDSYVKACALSCCNNYLAVVTTPDYQTLELQVFNCAKSFDEQQPKKILLRADALDSVRLAFSPDGTTLAMGYSQCDEQITRVDFWDMQDDDKKLNHSGFIYCNDKEITALAFSQDNSCFAVAQERLVKIFLIRDVRDVPLTVYGCQPIIRFTSDYAFAALTFCKDDNNSFRGIAANGFEIIPLILCFNESTHRIYVNYYASFYTRYKTQHHAISSCSMYVSYTSYTYLFEPRSLHLLSWKAVSTKK